MIVNLIAILRGDITRFIVVVIAVATVSCYNSFDPLGEPVEDTASANITIKQLHELLSADEYCDIKDDLIIAGYVTANDKGGNFYKSFYIEEEGYAIEFMEGLISSYVLHEEGCRMVIKLNGLRAARSQGVMQIGMAADYGSSYDVDYLGHEVIVDRYVTNTGIYSAITPREVTLSELVGVNGGLAYLCGSLFTVTGLKYSPQDGDLLEWEGMHCFVDASDPLVDGVAEHEVWCYVSPYSDFSAVEINGEVTYSITGILQSNSYSSSSAIAQITPRRIEDCLY